MRLNKYLALAGVASRRKCDEIIANGDVKVNGSVVTEMGTQINEKKDKVEYDGKILSLPKEYVYYKLNKPKGYICSAKDEKGRKTIYDLIKIPDVRLFSIGRLDYDTEGLIILTNDGELSQKIAHPSCSIEKEYIAVIEGEVKESELAVMRAGVVVDGDRMPACRVEYIRREGNNTRLKVVIDEGQNRQIRRMFEAIGRTIILLKRVKIGHLTLGGLSRGEYKELTDKEIYLLYNM